MNGKSLWITYFIANAGINCEHSVCGELLRLFAVVDELVELRKDGIKFVVGVLVAGSVPSWDAVIDLVYVARHNAEIVACTSHCPEQVRILSIVCCHDRTVRGHDGHLLEIVGDEAVEALIHTHTATETGSHYADTCDGTCCWDRQSARLLDLLMTERFTCNLSFSSKSLDQWVSVNATTEYCRLVVGGNDDAVKVMDVDTDAMTKLVQIDARAVSPVDSKEREFVFIRVSDLFRDISIVLDPAVRL